MFQIKNNKTITCAEGVATNHNEISMQLNHVQVYRISKWNHWLTERNPPASILFVYSAKHPPIKDCKTLIAIYGQKVLISLFKTFKKSLTMSFPRKRESLS